MTARRDRSPEVWDSARGLLDGLSKIEAKEEVPGAQEAIRRALADLASEGGPPVEIEEQQLRGVLAKLEVAWVHERAEHRIVVGDQPGPHREHHILHELQHLLLIEAARAARYNRWFASTAARREKAIRSMDAEVRRIARRGIPHDKIVDMVTTAVDGLLGQLFNFPIDLLIETRLLATYPDCRELLYQSVKSQLDEGASIAHNEPLKNATPRVIFHANAAMNGAFALWFENRFPGRTDLVQRFQKTESWRVSKRLYATWQDDSNRWTAGAEYEWIDTWASVLGLREWYEWRDGNPAPANR